ncbi:sestrin-1 [Elysia marginata]|uniref:Sestrin-1 n=1 Tax=Elysia marginata TaxID=1093978 RepID=A0AAV4ISC5_9GAST|nr:sestrin-1 [Elysia marginata]
MAGEEHPVPEDGLPASLIKIFNMVDSVHFLSPLSSRDRRARQRAFNNMAAMIEQHANGYGSPLVNGNGFMLVRPSGTLHGKSFLRVILPGILRLSVACPYQDVRDRAAALLQDIEVLNPK